MKIVITVNDAAMVVHTGGGTVERHSVIIDIPNESLPPLLRKYFEDKKWASEDPNRHTYTALEFSLLDEAREK